MLEPCDLQIYVNGEHKFILNQRIISRFSGRLKKIIDQEKSKTQIRNSGIEINDFPGGPIGFELISRFCYNNGKIQLSTSNVSLLHCSAIYLEMTEKYSAFNLLQQTENFLEGMFYWSWSDIIISLKSCELVFSFADTSSLLEKLICSLLAKITQNSDLTLTSSSSTSSSPETTSGFRFSSSSKTTPESNNLSSSSKAWWFDYLTIFSPKMIEEIIKNMDSFGDLILTKFLLHYLKSAVHAKNRIGSRCDYGVLADKVVCGIVSMAKTDFPCRKLFWVLRIVSRLGLSRKSRAKLERMIGGILDKATLDDLLISGNEGSAYDVNLVLRLIRVFVSENGESIQKLKKVGRLMDKYMGEISPDQNLKVSKFLAVAESLPDSARDSFNGVYRALDIYLESHPTLCFEERAVICRCLNYEKLSLEVCRDLAKNPRIPPKVTVKALLSQQSKLHINETISYTPSPCNDLIELYEGESFSGFMEGKKEMKMNLKRMQWRVVELEKVCKEMIGHMSKIAKDKVITTYPQNEALPRLC